MTKKSRNITLLTLAVLVLIFAPSIIVFSIDKVRETQEQGDRLLREYNFNKIYNYLKLSAPKDAKIVEENGITIINLSEVSFKPMDLISRADLMENMRSYKPYVDFFDKKAESLIVGGCSSMLLNVLIRFQPATEANKAKALVSLQDKCFGKIELSFSILNYSSETFGLFKKNLLNLKFKEAGEILETDDIQLVITPQTFGKNYKEAAEAQQSNIIGKDKELQAKALSAYKKFMDDKNLNSEAKEINYEALKKLMDITPSQWAEKEINVVTQIHFTKAVTLSKALYFVPNMVTSISIK